MARNDNEEPHSVDRHVGRRVQEHRLGQGLSQSALARALGVSFQQVQKYEKGTNRISASKLFEIARFLNVDLSGFFPSHDDPVRGVAEEAAAFDHDSPQTRHTVEIGRLAPQLTTAQQKMVAGLMRELIAGAVEEADSEG